MKKILSVFGTRPEAIKMAPVIKEIEKNCNFESVVVVTGQHRQMLDQVLETFQITPDYDLNIMKKHQTLSDITRVILQEFGEVLDKVKPDLILVHGDTTTAMAAAMAAFYRQIKIGHVEAGLRTGDILSPFPEEANRQIIDVLADIYFAPTEKSKKNLLLENKDKANIFVTGNTAIDAMKYTVSDSYANDFLDKLKNKKIILVTMHRRESIGSQMVNVMRAINKLIETHFDIEVVFPIHKNPKVRKIAQNTLKNSDRLHILEPLDVVDFQNFASRSYLIMTDSGGVQEEAPSLGVPVLVLRNSTERPEGIEAGTLKLVGTEEQDVIYAADCLLREERVYEKMSNATNPYGDGNASHRILKVIEQKSKKM